MKLFLAYLKSRLRVAVLLLVCAAIFAVSFALYHLPLAAVAYPALLCGLLLCGVLAVDFGRTRGRHRAIEAAQHDENAVLPEARTLEEAELQALVEAMRRQQSESDNQAAARYRAMIDYYTVWAHQIKTPIASMRLTLRGEDSESARRLSADLFRIEQYADMVLAYLRLDSESSDYVFREQELDEIVRRAVRNFSTEFIARRLHLTYERLETRIVTDEKWLGFVIEQLISNALKYTREGGIRIYMKDQYVLCIEDTGIGIASSDLPRVFERGYTGFNGRGESHSTGIGLYLCRRVCEKLGIRLSARSQVGQGTQIMLDMAQEPVRAE